MLDVELAQAFKANSRWGKRDRAFIAETVYEACRWRRSLEFVAGCEQVSAVCAAQWLRMGHEIPAWWNHQGVSPDEMAARETELNLQPRAVRESIPDWLDDWAVEELGEIAWTQELCALNQRAPVVLRVNTLKCSRDEAMAWLKENEVEAAAVEGIPEALVLPEGKVLPKALRRDGRVEIQDGSSQCIVPMLDAHGGERVIDACCGAGGKALQLAAVMGNKGRIYAMDVDERKLRELERRAKRAGAKCIAPKLITDKTADDFEGMADRLLIDSPCSGLGTLRRQPDLKWRLRPATIKRAREIQRELLVEYTRMLKPGGRLVYATCSILPSENRQAVEYLIEQGGFTLVEQRSLSPAKDGFDGFYAASLVRDQ